jgi:CheY-like chemotaxis protein
VPPDILLLLVEDEPLIQVMMQAVLEDGGFTVVAASSGDEALALVADKIDQVSGLITDIQLGDGPNGWAVARHARLSKAELPVVYMTGDSAADWAAEGVPKSIMLAKPFAPAQVVTAISALLSDAASSLTQG